LASWLTKNAQITHSLVKQKEFAAASQSVLKASDEILPLRQAIARVIVEMRNYEAEFVAISRALGQPSV
jgi:hypothetical protein